jgi:hypothetical protein
VWVDETKHRSIVKTFMTLGKGIHVDVHDGHAYVVVRAICYYAHRNGGHSRKRGILTLALTKTEHAMEGICSNLEQGYLLKK